MSLPSRPGQIGGSRGREIYTMRTTLEELDSQCRPLTRDAAQASSEPTDGFEPHRLGESQSCAAARNAAYRRLAIVILGLDVSTLAARVAH